MNNRSRRTETDLLFPLLGFKLFLLSLFLRLLSGSWVVRKRAPSSETPEIEWCRWQQTARPESSPATWVLKHLRIPSDKHTIYKRQHSLKNCKTQKLPADHRLTAAEQRNASQTHLQNFCPIICLCSDHMIQRRDRLMSIANPLAPLSLLSVVWIRKTLNWQVISTHAGTDSVNMFDGVQLAVSWSHCNVFKCDP